MYRPNVITRVASIALLAHVACSSSAGTDPAMMEDGSEGGTSPTPGNGSGSGGGGSGSSSGNSTPQPGQDGGAAGDAGMQTQTGADGGATMVGNPGQDGGTISADGSTVTSNRDASSTSSDGSSTSTTSDGSTGGGGDTFPPVTAAVVLSTLTVNQAGRTGADLVLTVTGTESNLMETPFGIDLRLEDSSGNPVLAFTDWSRAKTNERVVLFDDTDAGGMATFTKTVTLPDYYKSFPNIARVLGAIAADTGVSNSLAVNVTKQGFQTSGQTCDPTVLVNRCGLGLACIGKPSVCTTGVAPQISKFSYFHGTNGPRLIIAGTDPADDLSIIHLAFLNSSNKAVLVDMTGNGDYASSFDVDASSLSMLGAFFDTIQAAPMFDSTVAKLVATPIGTSTGSGASVTAAVATMPLAATGKSCDVRGFSGCATGDTCVANACVTIASAQSTAAAAAPVLDPSGSTIATGYTSLLSLWGDPPQGCMPQGVHAFPQGIARLHLSQGVSTLTLTAGNSETNFQNGLFVLSGTGASVSGTALGCNGSSPSTLTLKNMAAGDYTVVVNSRDAVGGEFAVSIE
jgi:hypothetical protein